MEHLDSGEYERYSVELGDGNYWELWFIGNRIFRIWKTSSGNSPKYYEAVIYKWSKLTGRKPDNIGRMPTGQMTQWTRYFWDIDLIYLTEDDQIIVRFQWDEYNCDLHHRFQLCSNRYCKYTWK